MPHLGRWMAIDPLAEKEPDKSPYNYVGNDPISYLDPDGKFRIDATFASRYPALARVVQYYLPKLANNQAILNSLSQASGISINSFKHMLEFGQGPWISVQRDDETNNWEYANNSSGAFDDSGSTVGIDVGLPENIFVDRSSVNSLEQAVKWLNEGRSNSFQIDKRMLQVTTRIIHELTHYLVYRGQGREAFNRGREAQNESGAYWEQVFFGTRMSYQFHREDNGLNIEDLYNWYDRQSAGSSKLVGMTAFQRRWQVQPTNHQFNAPIQPQRGDPSLQRYPIIQPQIWGNQ